MWLWVAEAVIAAQVARANDVVRGIVGALPGQNADALVRALTPGVAASTFAPATQPLFLLAVYTVIFALLGALLLRTGDVT